MSDAWSTKFRAAIPIAKGKPLKTLHDARAYVVALPKKQQNSERWQAAIQALLIAAECSNAMMAEIAMRQAINGPQEEVFDHNAK